MKMTFFIVVLALVLWFAVQNASAVELNLLLWEVTASLALVIGITFIIGFILGIAYLTPGLWRSGWQARKSEKNLEQVTKEKDELAEKSKTLEQQVEKLAPKE